MRSMFCSTPGRKIRSKGLGKGLARGRGLGPVGLPNKLPRGRGFGVPRGWGGRFKNLGF